ncbi:Eco57I restriction-modification methylase domain-containing protein [Enterococcus hirae]|uniref:Eco57I restriction-modification methylase domain-containing protein n=2 Tax=Enterococcus TaxID=1350 RepID=UPI001A00A66D|nr:Eco57I restriction-modification methylase domain-containing protein [Enterococcus hirae]
MTTSGVPYSIDWAELAYRPQDKLNPWFGDNDVHEVLKRSGYKKNKKVEGNEWWNVTLDVAKQAIDAVKENREVIEGPIINKSKIVLRPEQKNAVSQTKKVFKKKDRMLWNAKMRFGKTLSTYQLIKEEGYNSVLILSHRPVVSDSWFEDFSKLEMKEAGYQYGSKKHESIETLIKDGAKFVYFASIQDLRGSSQIGGKQRQKNELIFSTDWDLIVFDEAHEGTQTELAQNVEEAVKKKNTKVLELSGTPFNLLEQYEEEQVFTWDYVMEQEAKLRWSTEKPDEPNPYETLPKVNMFTFEMGNKEKYADDSKAFNFKEFFRVKDDGSFEHEYDVNNFLTQITKKSTTNYPYSTEEFRNELRHSLWLLPGIAEAKALKNLMDKHPIFGKEYKIINVVDNDDKEIISKDDPDLGRVRNAISDKPWETKTITLSVRKLTTGVNVKEWTAVMFLNNTTSAMNYLQAAFRAQTPYSNEVQGQKTNSYIFDFAPDRALTVMAESASINSGVGKRNTPEQKKKMTNMLNFLPIIGMDGNGMKTFSVDRMLTQLKKVYAEKAVRSGFDDDSLYSDALLTINPEAAELFEKLRGIIGKTGASKVTKKVKVNNQGLTDEEYETAEKAKKKKKRQRTLEEQEAIDKQNQAKKERRNAISILRGISIRIPLMIFGMEVDISKDIDVETFVNEVDDASWEEFMPVGVTKEVFREQAKYYDSEVFIEAGRIIRTRAKSYDDLSYTDRAEQIALLHGTFKNPDKETVLTPWRVVNMQLASMIGGLSYYNEYFSDTSINGTSALHWVSQEATSKIYGNNSKILEINSKTGLYPLFCAVSFFFRQQMEFINNTVGKITQIDEEKIIQKVLRENIYVIAKTPMAKTITQRTLVGYKGWDTNILFIPDLVKKIRTNIHDVEKYVQKGFKVMKFDAVVGNPPYQENDGGSGSSATPVYNKFIQLSDRLSNKYISLITPSKWFAGGKGLDQFRDYMLNNDSIKVMVDYDNAKELFPNTSIAGGVNYFIIDKDYHGKVQFTNVHDGRTTTSYRKMNEFDTFVRYNEAVSIIHKIGKVDTVSDFVYPRNPFGFSSKDRGGVEGEITLISSAGTGKVNLGDVKSGSELINKYKLCISKVTSEHANEPDKNGQYRIISSNFVVPPQSVVTDSYLVIYSDEDENKVRSYLKYLKTKFYRNLLLQSVTSINLSKDKFQFIPLQDFSKTSDIDWSRSTLEIDQQLYTKYGLDKEEIAFIEEKVKAID